MYHDDDRERTLFLSLRELTRHEGEDGLSRRLYYEIQDTDWDDTTKSKIYALIDLVMLDYHTGDPRDDNTYATHVLRVTNRIVSRDHFNYRDNPDIIIAALLHDVVEDRPERLLDEEPIDKSDIEGQIAQRERALAIIAGQYGDDVAVTVSDLSNGIYNDRNVTQSEKHELYRAHVRNVLGNGGAAAMIKLSDFIDNCLGLGFNDNPEFRLKLARKYAPLIPHMAKFALESDLTERVITKIDAELEYAKKLCARIIESHGAVATVDGLEAPWFGSSRTLDEYNRGTLGVTAVKSAV